MEVQTPLKAFQKAKDLEVQLQNLRRLQLLSRVDGDASQPDELQANSDPRVSPMTMADKCLLQNLDAGETADTINCTVVDSREWRSVVAVV